MSMTCQFASGACRGRIEWHHCVAKNRLKRMFPIGATPSFYRADAPNQRWRPLNRFEGPPTQADLPLKDILGDTRNRVFLCSHHHELVTNGRLKVELPDSVWAFAAEFGLTGMLENDLRKAA